MDLLWLLCAVSFTYNVHGGPVNQLSQALLSVPKDETGELPVQQIQPNNKFDGISVSRHTSHLRKEDSDSVDGIHNADDESVFQFPEVLNMSFKLPGKEVQLILDFSEDLLEDVPEYTDINGTLQRIQHVADRHYALYENKETNAPFIVSCTNRTQSTCRLESPLRIGDDSWLLKDKDKPKTMKKHFLKRTSKSREEIARFDFELPVPDHPTNGGQGPGPMASARRQKRAFFEGQNHIEAYVLCDFSCFEYFHNELGLDLEGAREEAKIYIYRLIHDVDLHFLSLGEQDPTFRLRIVVKGIILIESEVASPWSADTTTDDDGVGYIDAYKSLRDLQWWRQKVGASLTGDHLLAITRRDVAVLSEGMVTNTGAVGLSYMCAMCSNYSVSINELWHSRASSVIAHELGHSTCASHDMAADCSNSNVMSSSLAATAPDPTTADSQWRFSTCSAKVMAPFVRSSYSACLRDQTLGLPTYSQQFRADLSGQTYDLHAQCQLVHGSGSSACYHGNSNRVSPDECFIGIRCDEGDGCSSGPYYPTYVLPGTPCGTNKYCLRGRCVEKPGACRDRCTQPGGTRQCEGVECCYQSWGKTSSCCQKCCQSHLFVDCPST